MAENGKNSGLFASNGLNWEADGAAKDAFEQQIATKGEVANYVNNAFKQWHEPDHFLLLRTVKVVETMLQFLQEEGLEIKDGKVLLSPDRIQVWADKKMAEAQAAQTPKEQQS
jgi:hypothetical protein